MKTEIRGPQHDMARAVLRVGGPMFLLAGLVFMIIGVASFFSAFGSMDAPKYFWCCFLGIPCLFVGGVMTSYGYMGAVARYVAAESAPVAKDTVNYMADGTQDAVRTVARAVTEGIREASAHGSQEKKDKI